MKIKTIKKHIIFVTLMIVLIPICILATFTCTSNNYAAQDKGQTSVELASRIAAQRVKWELQSYLLLAEDTGCNRELSDTNIPSTRKQQILDSAAARLNMTHSNIIGADGKSIFDNTDFSDNACFIEAMKGNASISEPTVSPVNGESTIVVAAPLRKDGKGDGDPVGCVYFVPDEQFLNDIVRDLNVSTNSVAYMLNKEGTVIAHCDDELVANPTNYINLAQEDSRYSSIADVHKKMTAGEQGVATVEVNGESSFVGYAPIEGTDGWSIAVSAPDKDFMRIAKICIVIAISLFIVAAVISLINSGRMGKNIGDPVAECTKRLKLLSEGDLTSPVPQVNTVDETRTLADATEQLVGDMNSIISDIGRMLDSMANGNFDVSSSCGEGVYRGDFHVLIESVNEINGKLSNTISQINESADMVSSGSEQVSGGAQGLAQGATEQASSIEQLTSTVENIAEKVSDTTEHCINGRRLADESAEYIAEATSCMNNLTDAMQDINEASNEISRIIKAIEDIAFQTNILALNAAVEAARAGEAGKGFAVVADEVRNLASKASEAAQETTALIEKAVNAIENGKGITEQTASAVADVAQRSEEVRSIVTKIAEASAVQAEMISQVTQGMEQISGVVQNNSATAEESAAASEELSGQAVTLKKLVGGFTLKNS
ncbi:MAG: methyl-accepting chemotaxis protein [Oscillospiraceae bacterium]